MRGVFFKATPDICDMEIKLSDKERQILSEVASGHTTPQIAVSMGLASETVKWYRKRLLDKFNASTSAEIVRKAIELQILQL